MDSGKSRILPQIVAATAACLGSFSLGAALGWTSPALPRIQENFCLPDNCDITGVSEEQGSWIGAVLPLGAMASGPVTGYLIHSIGRKWTMIWYSLPLAIGNALYLVANAADDVISIFIGRFLTGFAAGAFALTAPVYIVDVSQDSIRGALASLMQLSITGGIALVDGLNIKNAVSWQVISGICILLPVILAVVMFFMPESPFYLVTKGRYDEAEKSLQWLRGKDYNPKHDVEVLKQAQEDEKATGAVTVKELLTKRRYLQPLLIVVGLMFFQQFSGVNFVIFYTQEIFVDAGSDLDQGLSSFLVVFAQFLATGLAVLVVEKFGRKVLLLVSIIFMCLSLYVLGVYFYMKEFSSVTCEPNEADCVPEDGKFDSEKISNLGWLPLASLVIFIVAFSLGFGPLPWAINAEIHPEESRDLSASVGFVFNWLCAFFVTKFEADLEDAMGGSFAVYFLFGSLSFVGVLYVLVLVPETKGLSEEELRMMFDKSAGHEHIYRDYEKRMSVISR